MDDPVSRGAYQVFLYVLLFVGTAGLGGFVGYIVSFLYYGRPEQPEAEGSAKDNTDSRKADTQENMPSTGKTRVTRTRSRR